MIEQVYAQFRRKMRTNNGYNNGRAANDDYTGFTYELEEPIAVKGSSVT